MIRDLQFFARLCRKKSIRKAAETLHITPQGLSKAMKNLETALGVQLFTRSNEGIVLTEAGKIVAKRSKRILDTFTDMKLELRDHQASVPSQVRVALSSGVINALQPDFIYDFQNRFPELDIIVAEYPDLPCEEAVLGGDADVGFAIGPVDKRKFDFFKVHGERICAIVNKLSPLAGDRNVSLRDLTGEKWALPNEKFKSHHAVVSKCAALGVRPKIEMLAGDIAMLHKYCHLHTGLAFVNESGAGDSRYDNVTGVTLGRDSAMHWEVNLVTRKTIILPPAARSFVDHVKKWFDAGK